VKAMILSIRFNNERGKSIVLIKLDLISSMGKSSIRSRDMMPIQSMRFSSVLK
jgi:hypothetical protein